MLAAASCVPHGAPPKNDVPPAATPVTMLFTDLGDLHHAVTASKAAQPFFDQGLRLIYGFNHAEAIRSFQEAIRLDPECAMAYWGVALALGPNYNLPSDPESEALARKMTLMARALEPKVTPPERDYIEAVARRYAGAPAADRRSLDADYANAMREVAKKHPDDLDAQVLFAESMMDLRPWMLWDHEGNPAPGTEEINATLERVLVKDPRHPGANHYYMHAQEAGPHPEKAKPCADRMPSLMPGAGHLVHMPSHIYIHTADWKAASEANEKAIDVDRAYLAKAKPQGAYPMMYVGHNFQFLWATASMEGRSAVAIKAARDMAALYSEPMITEMSKQMPGLDYVLVPPMVALVRFGKWQEVLNTPPPPREFRNLTAMWHFTRALALARTGDTKQARTEQEELARFVIALKDDDMVGPLNSARSVFTVATKMLASELDAAEGEQSDAIALMEEAVAAEDALNYDEPPPWPLPTRQYLGALYLEAKRPADAIKVYQADLKRFPENGWSLFGLSQAYQTGRAIEAKDAQERFKKAWSRADVTITSSRF